MKYESFWIRIEPSTEGSYTISVESPQGEGLGTFQLPETDHSCTDAESGAGREAKVRDFATPRSVSKMPALDTGKELFQALFRDEVSNLFHTSLGSLRGQHKGLRISISVNPRRPELASVLTQPWELLCRPETEDFLCLSRRTPVVRSLEAHRERRPAIARPRRLRILAIAANPTDCLQLDVEREYTSLQKAWKGQEKNVEIVLLERGGVEEMRQTLLATPFHILHFMGHGKFDEKSGEGALVFENHDGSSQPFEARRLAQLLHDFVSLRLVVLNACHTADAVGFHGSNPFAGVASSLVMGGVPAVVAMSGPVPDEAAVAFSRTLYQRLALGDPIEAAVTEGRLAIQRVEPEDGAWAIPALFLRSSDGLLFAPRSTVWARRAAVLAGFTLALALIWLLATAWLQERRATEVMRLTNDGIGFQELGRQEEAQEAFRSALEIDPANAAALGNLAIVEMQLGEDEAALAHLQSAARAAPEQAIYHYNLGNLLALRKRHEEALQSLRRAIEIDPNYTYAYNELGNLYLELDHPTEARKAFEAGLRHDRTVAKLHKNLARVSLAEGRPEEAVVHLKAALALYSPSDAAGRAEATWWMAVAQVAAGRAPEVCGTLKQFEILDPRGLSPFAKEAPLLAKEHGCAS